MHVLIDETGRLWEPHAPSLRQRVDRPIAAEALPDYLMCGQGFVSLSIAKDTVVIKGAPAWISYATYSVVVEFIEARPIRRVALRWFDGYWHDEAFFGADVMEAKSRLLALMLDKRQHGRRYLSFPRELDSLTQIQPLYRLLDFWRSVDGRIDPVEHEQKLYQLTHGKFLTIGRMDGGGLKFTSIGQSLAAYRDSSWILHGAGAAVEDQPDYLYGSWLAAGYREAIARNQPSVSDFDTVVHDARNQSTQRHNYTRLLLPIRTQSGEVQLLSAPRAEMTIDISLEVLQEIS